VDEEQPFGQGVEFVGSREELDALHPRHPLVGQHDGDVLPTRLKIPQPPQGGLCRLLACHEVVCPIAIAELALDALQILGLIVDGDQNRPEDAWSIHARHVLAFLEAQHDEY
jgi:hypothetical protein